MLDQCGNVANHLIETLPFNVLQGVVGSVLFLADIEDGDDIGVVHAGGGARFLLKTLHGNRVKALTGTQHFEGYLTSQCDLLRLVNDTHAAAADLAEDAIAGNFRKGK